MTPHAHAHAPIGAPAEIQAQIPIGEATEIPFSTWLMAKFKGA